MKIGFSPILRTDLPGKTGLCRIDFRIYFEGKVTKISTDKKVKPEHWDKTKNRVLSSCEEAELINSFLLEKESFFNRYLMQKQSFNKEIYLEEIKAMLTGKNTEERNIRAVLIDDLFNKYIEKLKNSGKKKNSIDNIKSARNIMIKYQYARYKKSVSIEKIDLEFVEDLKTYLREDCKNSENSLNKRLKNFKSAIRYAILLGYDIKDPFENYKIKEGEPKEDYLTEEEYKLFRKYKLPKGCSDTLKRSRALFIFACETGLRYSDVMSLDFKDLKVDEKTDLICLKKKQTKTSNTVTVFFSPIAERIFRDYLIPENLDKMSGLVFETLGNQTINENIRKIADAAKLNKHLTFHVARHTFASNLASKKCNTNIIMKLLGDKTPKLANTYINADDDTLRKVMEESWAR